MAHGVINYYIPYDPHQTFPEKFDSFYLSVRNISFSGLFAYTEVLKKIFSPTL